MAARRWPAWAVLGLAAAGLDGAVARVLETVSPPVLPPDEECALATGTGCSSGAPGAEGSMRRVAAGSEEWRMAFGLDSYAAPSCHTAMPGEPCYDKVWWAMHEGLAEHPDWYPGLTATSSIAEFQAQVHTKDPGSCPRPCGLPQEALWCSNSTVPALWTPAAAGPPMTVKILTYNLFWWSLYKLRAGNGESAGKLIKANLDPEPFDVMGFQECESPARVLEPVGLLGQYEAFLGNHAICVAYNTDKWLLLARGDADVAEDMPTRYYGKRGTQWLRLMHKKTNRTLFFINHHGPLAVNSGGVCGGESVADHLLEVMSKNAQVGDAVVLVGDFNANAGSLTIQKLWRHLVHVFVGPSWGGVDNIFSNVDADSVVETKVLGDGGSDHDAISATIRVGGGALDSPRSAQILNMPLAGAKEMTGAGKPGFDWQYFWCGLLEQNIEYALDPGSATTSAPDGSRAPDWCCRACQGQANCSSWVWREYSDTAKGPECLVSGALPTGKEAADGVVSGLAYIAASEAAAAAAAKSISRV